MKVCLTQRTTQKLLSVLQKRMTGSEVSVIQIGILAMIYMLDSLLLVGRHYKGNGIYYEYSYKN